MLIESYMKKTASSLLSAKKAWFFPAAHCIAALCFLSTIHLLFAIPAPSLLQTGVFSFYLLLTGWFIHKEHTRLRSKVSILLQKYHMTRRSLNNTRLELLDQQKKRSSTLQKYHAAEFRHREVLKFLSSHDPITHLPNHILFKQQLASFVNSPHKPHKSTALLFIELEGFKQICSMFGHATGDDLLCRMTKRLKEHFQTENQLCRLGSDVLMLLLPNLETLAAINSTTRLVAKCIHAPLFLRGKSIQLDAHIGISLFPEDARDANTLIKMAETAMHRAREQGPGSIQYYMDEMELNIAHRLEMENELRLAIKENQFSLHYQPQVDQYDRIVGAEALIRWKHPIKGLVSPAEFIPIAEECGAILPIGEWVIKTACRHNKMWQEMGFAPFSVSINLSARQFQQTNLQQIIFDGLKEAALDPQWLTVEITETAAMADASYTTLVLQDLKRKGIKISLDDFGIGYSSLIYLKRFPVDMLKIDRSFVSDIGENSDGACIVKTILGLGHTLKLKVVAEGVETLEQLNFLRQENCSHIQGFLFSRPLPFDEMTQKLQQHSLVS